MNEVKSVYAAYTTDKAVRFNSSSGGLFTIMALEVLNQSGIVYGVGMTDDCYSSEYKRVVNADDLKSLQGSKYIQSNIGGTFNTVKNDLENGREVLFSGTGCQVNGLKAFLQKDYSNLICVDVVCHGVPSEELWKKYVLSKERSNGKLKSVNFRCKEHNWENFGMKENQLFISKDVDSYMRFFLDNNSLRPSCYNCRAKSYKQSDITIADFWGIKDVAPDMFDGKGTSLVIVRSDIGASLFDCIKNQLRAKQVSYEEGVAGNSPEYISVYKPVSRSDFYTDMNQMSFSRLERKYNPFMSYKYRTKQLIKKILKIDRGGTSK